MLLIDRPQYTVMYSAGRLSVAGPQRMACVMKPLAYGLACDGLTAMVFRCNLTVNVPQYTTQNDVSRQMCCRKGSGLAERPPLDRVVSRPFWAI